MLYYTGLEKKIFDPNIVNNSDKLFVISGYVGTEIIKKLGNFKDTKFEVIYGMYGSDSISEPLHKKLKELNKELPNVCIKYSTIPVHSKIYLWLNNNKIKSGLIGSANFTISGLRKDYKETLCDIDKDSYEEYEKYFKYVLERSIECNDQRITLKKHIKPSTYKGSDEQPLLAEGICKVSLLSRGEVPEASGLNWGCSKGHVTKGDAYIRISVDYIKNFPDLFPPKKYVDGIINTTSNGKMTRENDEVELIWDDGTSMIGLMEGQIKVGGVLYPKQLSTSPSKNILGIYLRKRLGNLPLDYVITKNDLIKYGRTDIYISKIGEGIYYLDFSVSKEKKK